MRRKRVKEMRMRRKKNKWRKEKVDEIYILFRFRWIENRKKGL